MQSSLAFRAFGAATTPCRPQTASRRSLVVSNVYGDLPKIGGGRKWEYLKTNENGKVERQRMHVKKGDFVMVITGSDKGKTGTVLKSLPKLGVIIVEGVNIKTKHVGPRSENEKGQIKKQEYPFHHSNVQHYSKDKQVRSRIGHKEVDGRKVRFLVKTGEILD